MNEEGGEAIPPPVSRGVGHHRESGGVGNDMSDVKTVLLFASHLSKQSKHERAEAVLRFAIASYPGDFRAFYNLATLLLDGQGASSQYEQSLDLYMQANSLDPSVVEIYGTIAGLLIKMQRPSEAVQWCQRGLAVSTAPPHSSACYFNLNIAMRQLGQLHSATLLTWAALETDITADSMQQYRDWQQQQQSPPKDETAPSRPPTFVCVKWGTKYGSEYVNRLAAMLQRHWHSPSTDGGLARLVCLTDDPTGIDAETVECRWLPRADVGGSSHRWRGWWLKACVFSLCLPSAGSVVVYLDLDTVIVGSLSWVRDAARLCSQENCIVALSAGELASEGRREGINSSLLVWGHQFLCGELFRFLDCHHDALLRCIYKFDHYLEMMLSTGGRVRFLHEIAPSAALDYSHLASVECRGDRDALFLKASIVCFPLQPKPKECAESGGEKDDWVRVHWRL